ncbi:MAG: heterodisulfide reductase-related iron-sulfur binding cluster [Candidatus Helarchaeota archaeon]
MTHTIFPGCLVQYRFPEYEKSAYYILDVLGIEYKFVDTFSCCGSQIIETVDDSILNITAGRNLALAEKSKIYSIITLCGSCTYILKKTRIELETPSIKEIVNQNLKKIDLEYQGKAKVRHLAEFLNEKETINRLKTKIVKKLNLKIVFQNPCMLMRPDRISRIESEKYELIKKLLEICGVKVLDYEFQNKCCEGTMLAFKKELGEPLVKKRYKILESINADLIIISCPNCQLVYNIFPTSLDANIMPSIFFTQLLGHALGGSYKDLGLNRNIDFKRIKNILV